MIGGGADQSVVGVDPAVGGALGGAVGRVPSSQHAAMVTLLAHAAAAATPGICTVVTICWVERHRGIGREREGGERGRGRERAPERERGIYSISPLSGSLIFFMFSS